MANIVSKRHFVCADLEKNSNKFWIGELYDDGLVRLRYGRVGSGEQVTEKQFGSQHEAQKFFDGKVKDKQKVKSRRDAYTEINVIEETGSVVKTIGNKDIADIALQEIQTNTQAAKEFVKWLCKINKHNILTNTTIKYDISDGTFRTPLGVIDKSCLNKARDLLDKIEPFIERRDFNNKQLTSLVNQYLRYIPQDLGESIIKSNIYKDSNKSYIDIECVCGKTYKVLVNNLKYRNRYLCPKCSKAKIKKGEECGNLVFINYVSKDRYLCFCKSCKQQKIIHRRCFRKSLSCGCYRERKGKDSPNYKGYEDITGQFFSTVRCRAKRQKIQFDISEEYIYDLFIKQNRKCALTDLKIELPNHTRNHTASLDRIDSSKGYIVGNVWWLHKDVNIMKKDHDLDYFKHLCKLISNKENNVNKK